MIESFSVGEVDGFIVLLGLVGLIVFFSWRIYQNAKIQVSASRNNRSFKGELEHRNEEIKKEQETLDYSESENAKLEEFIKRVQNSESE